MTLSSAHTPATPFSDSIDSSEPARSSTTPPNIASAFRSTLVARLKGEHAELTQRGDNVMRSFERGDLEKAVIQLDGFCSLIHSHLLRERGALFTYLERIVSKNQDQHKDVQKFQAEINQFDRTIFVFFAKNSNLGRPGHEYLLERFPFDLSVNTRTLAFIISREESVLFPLLESGGSSLGSRLLIPGLQKKR